jgi:uncharacterized NAD(P)/FAD-binding protein YdhS
MRSDRPPAVAIVGGGASGTMVAAQLARREISSVVIDGSGRAGRGVAYSTSDPAHLLNVRAEGMSAWPDESDHFARWFGREGGQPRDFARRLLFGRYLREVLDDAVASGHVQIARAMATGAVREAGGWRVSLADGSAVNARALVLAVGNQEPEPLAAFAGVKHRLIANPWDGEARAAVTELARSGAAALLVGTGLTMVDLVLSLDAAGHQGTILAVSRRGLFPRGHADVAPAPVGPEELPPGGVRALLRWLRRRSAEVGSRAAIDSLRPHSQALWQGLDLAQQKRFLRHARPWWDVHRHRIAPQIAATIARLVGEGRLRIMAGRIVSARQMDGVVEVDIRRRGAAEAQRGSFAYVFNCTGPLASIARTRDPLLRGLLDSGEVKPDPLGIGIEVDGTSRAAPHLWALGPLTKGRYWEIVAVPDIREQAAAVAGQIEQEFSNE